MHLLSSRIGQPWLPAALCVLAIGGCGGHTDSPSAVTQKLSCDDSIKTGFAPDANTKVLLVKSFKKGDALVLTGSATSSTPTAANDMCVVKLNVGPGNPGPANAPSTSPGIGIEVWLPSPANWNKRLHVEGGGGWVGGVHESLTQLAGAMPNRPGAAVPEPFRVAGEEGAVAATTDTGHSVSDGSFAMKPDGTPNTVLWNDFSQRAIHEMAVKAKALASAYYGAAPKYAYWDGFSTGGRQGLKEAQANPADFDGILDGAPAINWTRFISNELYPQIVMQRDLGGTLLGSAQLSLVSNAAINACDVVGGQHLGYIADPSQCRYDPTQDTSVLCTANGGSNASAACVTAAQATAFNKIWYGQTVDGSVPSPATDNSFALTPSGSQLWYGLTRGTDLSALAGSRPFTISTDLVALELQTPAVATPSFINATGNGANGWTALTYAQLANASAQGLSLQSTFANINTDNPDLSAFRSRGGKLLMYHGLADVLIMPQGSINYYNRVADQMGGVAAIQDFFRFYLVPGMAHGLSNGTANLAADPPLPTHDQLYAALTNWVENRTAPNRIDISNGNAAAPKSRPVCVYPAKGTYTSGNPNQAASYTCS